MTDKLTHSKIVSPETLLGIVNPLGFPKELEIGDWESQYRAAIHTCGLFDLRGLGILQVAGRDAESLLHRLSMNEMRNLPAGAWRVNAFTDAKGKLVEAFLLLRRSEDFLLLTGFGRAKLAADWLEKYTFIEDVAVKDWTENLHPLLLTGKQCLATLGLARAPEWADTLSLAGHEVTVLSVAHVLPRGLLILASPVAASNIRDRLARQDSAPAVHAGGLAFHTLRVEQGVPLAGFEITGDSNPYEAGLREFISYEKGCYIGQEVIARLESYNKIKYDYVGLVMERGEFARLPAEVSEGEKTIGTVTSVAYSPETATWLAIARIRRKHLEQQSQFVVKAGGLPIPARRRDFRSFQ